MAAAFIIFSTLVLPLFAHAAPAGEDVQVVLDHFYREGLRNNDIAQDVDTLLKAHPADSRAHEMAGYLARLHGDQAGQQSHFAAAALDADNPYVDVYLSELMTEDRTLEEDKRLLEVLRSVAAAHHDPEIRFRAGWRQAQLLRDLGKPVDAQRIETGDGLVRLARIIGPFENDQGRGFSQVFPPENEQDFSAEYPGKNHAVRWRTAQATHFHGGHCLTQQTWPAADSVVYLLSFVRSSVELNARLGVGGDGGLKAWINGTEVLSVEKLEAEHPDAVTAPVTLRQGWNVLLVKAAHRSSHGDVFIRLSGMQGEPLRDLTVTAQPPPDAIPRGNAPSSAAVGEIAPGPLSARDRFLTARRFQTLGHDVEKLRLLEAWAADAPDNALAHCHLAAALKEAGHAEKATDLLHQGVRRWRAVFPLFLRRRALNYLDAHLNEKAQEDLEADLKLAPGHRASLVKLAEVYSRRQWQIPRCKMLEKASGRWPTAPLATREWSRCLEGLGRFKQAEALLRRQMKERPGDSTPVSGLVSLLKSQGRHDEALKANQALRALEPQHSAYLRDEAEMRWMAHGAADARAWLTRALEVNPDSAILHKRLALVLEDLDDLPAAVSEYQRVSVLDPSDSFAADRVEALNPSGLKLQAGDAFVPTEEMLDALAERARDTHAPAGAGVWVVLDSDVMEIAADGSSTHVVTSVQKAVSEPSRDRLIEANLPSTGRWRLLQAYVLTGSERQEASSIRGNKVRFRQVEQGSVVVLQYLHRQPPPVFVRGHASWTRLFQVARGPTLDANLVLLLNKTLPFHQFSVGNVEHQQTQQDDFVVHHFHASNVPALVTEPGMIPEANVQWRVSLSTLGSWDEFVGWERALLADAVIPSSDVAQMALKLTEQAHTPQEKLDALLSHSVTRIRYQQDYETTIAGVKPHPPAVVLARGYGDCKDKAMLIIALARELGITAEFALLRTRKLGRLKMDIPTQQFDHAIVHVPQQPGIERAYFMDGTGEGLDLNNLRPDVQGATSLVLDLKDGAYHFEEIPFSAPDQETTVHQISVTIDSLTRATAKDVVTLKGSAAASIRALFRNPKQAEKSIPTMVALVFPDATLQSFIAPRDLGLTHPVQLTTQVDASRRLAAPSAGMLTFRLPELSVLDLLGKQSKRSYPMDLSPPRSITYVTLLTAPKGYAPDGALAAAKHSHPCLTYERTVHTGPRWLQVTEQLTLTCAEVAPADYPGFRRTLQEVMTNRAPPVAFRRAG